MPKISASLLDNGEVRIPHRSENDGGVGLLVGMAVSKAKITLLKKSFWEKYGDDLVKSLKANLSAYLEKVIVIIMCGDVAEVDTSIHTSSEAAVDADTMYKASEGIQRVSDMRIAIDVVVWMRLRRRVQLWAARSREWVSVRGCGLEYARKFDGGFV
ncbi:hypothetical protein ON010_g9143 [Phytophthora cinnamomi]|nr:hypothetical protein ON010_g9143 [Phytophthora cinnamomi]